MASQSLNFLAPANRDAISLMVGSFTIVNMLDTHCVGSVTGTSTLSSTKSSSFLMGCRGDTGTSLGRVHRVECFRR